MINNEGLTVTRNNHKEEDCQSETKEQRVCPALKQRRTYRFTYKQKEKESKKTKIKKNTTEKFQEMTKCECNKQNDNTRKR